MMRLSPLDEHAQSKLHPCDPPLRTLPFLMMHWFPLLSIGRSRLLYGCFVPWMFKVQLLKCQKNGSLSIGFTNIWQSNFGKEELVVRPPVDVINWLRRGDGLVETSGGWSPPASWISRNCTMLGISWRAFEQELLLFESKAVNKWGKIFSWHPANCVF